ncbi:hypothetical protein SSX86_016546 [Deinandra increscens subsp. villosa]|uniref:RING-type E3 ubiquitin transferase n=1 Tax=Deinandra increscens subsp. villosa TaxID=3103831 RepID=A0AAP0D2F6_9ASTR
MEKERHILRLIFFFSCCCFLLRCTSAAAADDNCQPAACRPTEPTIRFPFRIIDQQPSRCGFPGFNLSCDELNRTIIRLSPSSSYIVNRIDYLSQAIYIDSDFCRLNEINSFNVANTPFDFSSQRSYTFYNCSLRDLGIMYPAVQFACLSSANHSVFAGQTEFFRPGYMPSNCQVLNTLEVPVRLNGDIRSELELRWLIPSCRSCEMEGKACGMKYDNGQAAGCLGSSPGSSNGAKYGLGLGIGVPTSIGLIGLIYYVASRARDHNETHHQGTDFLSVVIIPQPPSRTGLDRSTIESYQKAIFEESSRLPNDDSTCAICLSDYKPKESLRTIPECNHYFHVDCIDEWLKLNTTCPVCRNSPESSSLIISRSAMSTTSIDTS